LGKRVGGTNFQPAGSVFIRGVLEEDFGVPHRSIHWFTERGEDIDFDPPDDLRITRIDHNDSLDDMILSGRLDARIEPEFPQPFLQGDPRIVRLFPEYKEVEQDYFRRTGIFPIMHVTVIKQEIVSEHPWVVKSLMDAFEKSKAIAYRRMENPRVAPLAWFSSALEEQYRVLGRDPWQYGLTPQNRLNLEAAIRYANVQGLTSRRWSVDELFSTP
jgi:4,5-dihydroxyphthalate decarboxylase